MRKYYLNRNTQNNPNNDNEVHRDDCHLLPLADGIDLGYHPNCQSAIQAGRTHYNNVDGCAICIPECHTR